jgi:exodeoxyribonuclease V gamma subunit
MQVAGLLEFPGIKEKFGLVESDLKTIERWIRETHIRWGIDKDSRLNAGLPGYSENTWRAGLERLLLGYALPGENRFIFNGILPYDNIEGEDAQILGRFLEFTERLFTWAKTMVVPKKLSDWQRELLAALEHFFKPDESSERDLQFLRHLLDGLSEKESASNFHEKLSPEVIRCYLKSVLTQNNYGAGFLKGGVTFGAMLPMRSIPFKIICLIGMNNDAFPRDYQPLNFDLMAKQPQTGDRSRRKDDKYLFLESIVSARSKLYISYVGQSIQDNSRIPPSVLVSELLDTIEKSFELPGKNVLDQIVTTHRLQPFSAGYFQQGSGLFSYSVENMRACVSGAEKTEHRPFISRKIPLSPQELQEWQELELDSICLFFNHPAKFFAQRRLGIILENEAALADERENFELGPLDRYLVEQNLIKSRLAGITSEDFGPVQRALGQLPHGKVGDYRYNEMSIDVESFVAKTAGFTGGTYRPPMEVDFDVANFHLRGRLATITEAGCVHIRYARQRAKDLLNSWIYHLVFCHLSPPGSRPCSFMICKDSTVQFEPVADGIGIIEDLLALLHRGLEQPIHFFPDSSYEYAVHLLQKAASKQAALNKARRRWNGSDFAKFSRGESEDSYYDLCFRSADPLDESFKKIAVSVFSPLLACAREIML